jgi:hypothetical protein
LNNTKADCDRRNKGKNTNKQKNSTPAGDRDCLSRKSARVSQNSTDMHRSGIKNINEGESPAMHFTDNTDHINLSPTGRLETSCLNKIKEKEK